MKDFLTEELDIDHNQTFINIIKDLKKDDVPNTSLVEELQKQMDILSGQYEDTPVKMTEEEMEKMMEVLASGKPIITEEILETLQRLVNLPGITTIHYVMEGHKRRPFRGKMVCYAIRSADGDEVRIPKIARRPNGPKTMIMPLTEKRKLFSLSDNMAVGPNDERWNNVVTRFSAAYTILERIVQGMQSDQILQPNATEQLGVDQVLHGEGDTETQETQIVSRRTGEATLENTQD